MTNHAFADAIRKAISNMLLGSCIDDSWFPMTIHIDGSEDEADGSGTLRFVAETRATLYGGVVHVLNGDSQKPECKLETDYSVRKLRRQREAQ